MSMCTVEWMKGKQQKHKQTNKKLIMVIFKHILPTPASLEVVCVENMTWFNNSW